MQFLKKNSRSLITLLCALVIFLFFWRGFLLLDPDYNYRLVTGQKILTGFFPTRDPYSYTMPSFPYVEHSWIIAATWAFLEPLITRAGLALIWALIAFVSVIIASKTIASKDPQYIYPDIDKAIRPYHLWYFGRFTFLLALITLFSFVGIRAQIVSWLFITSFAYVILNKNTWKRFKIATPLFFLLWGNVHGSWSAGLILFGIVVITRTLKERKFLFTDTLLLLFSAGATLINPYGLGSWREVYLSVSDSALRWRISEWMPPFLTADLGFVAYFVVSLVFVARYRKKFSLEHLMVYSAFLLQACLSRRHVPLWVLVSLPLTTESVAYLYEEVAKIKFGKKRFHAMYKFAFLASVAIVVMRLYFSLESASRLSETAYYPVEAVTYLHQHLPENEIFTTYGWGGYLIRYLPEKKVYIYGAMPSWKWTNNPPEEAADAFTDYLDLLDGKKDYKEEFEKYQIQTVLLPPASEKDTTLQDIEDRLSGVLNFFGYTPPNFDLHEALKTDGWDIVFEDDTSVVYQK